MTTKLCALLLALLVLCGACRASAGAVALPHGSWRVVELDGASLGELERRPELTLADDGKLSGFTGLNRFQGTYDPAALRDGRLTTGPLAATRMAGSPAAMQAEGRLLELLGQALRWRREAGGLELRHAGRIVMRLEPGE